jgi:hypothetical protein
LSKRRKKYENKQDKTRMTIFVQGDFISGKKTLPGFLLGDDGKTYGYSRIDSRWHLIAAPEKKSAVTDDKSVLGTFVYIARGEDLFDTYQWQMRDGLIQLLLVSLGTKEPSRGYVRHAGTKSSRAPGS